MDAIRGEYLHVRSRVSREERAEEVGELGDIEKKKTLSSRRAQWS